MKYIILKSATSTFHFKGILYIKGLKKYKETLFRGKKQRKYQISLQAYRNRKKFKNTIVYKNPVSNKNI